MKFSDTICVKFHEDYDQTAVEDKLPVSIERPINFYALDFGKIKVEKLSSMNWIFILQKSISRLIFAGYTVWQYGLWSFQSEDTKLERFLPKNQHTQRKVLNFEFWINGKQSNSAKI